MHNEPRVHESLPGRSTFHRFTLLLSMLVVVGLSFGAVSMGAGGAESRTINPTPEPLILTIKLHSCPDNLDATGFYQYQQQCTSEKGLYGVPLSFSQAGREPTTVYSQPDESGGVLPILANFIGFGLALTISEPVAFVTRDSVVFCSQHLIGNTPPELDGTQIQWNAGAISFPAFTEGTVTCDWYRFPGGVESEPVTGDPASPNTYHQILVRSYVCPLGTPYQLPDLLIDAQGTVTTPNPAPPVIDLQGDLAFLTQSCADATTPFTFHLSSDANPDQTMGIGGQDPLYTGWNKLASGTYTIREEIPAGFANPVVLCEALVRGDDGKDVRTPLIPVVSSGAITHDLGEYASMTCDWFNFTANVIGQGLVPQDNQAAAGDEGAANDDQPAGADLELDTDGDGVTDVNETNAGTDLNSKDTDQDGLYDWDEPNVYGTDPLNPDTDGDGDDDGLEVYSGTDPLLAG
ncbi:hypothetical protein BH09CHL1_BH09CHL1_24560 [soil metagenome]